jgi:hypothetical protein
MIGCNLDISHSWVPNCELEYDLCQKDVVQEAEAKVQVVVVVVVLYLSQSHVVQEQVVVGRSITN